MIINNPQEYFVIVRSISCTELGLGEDRCFRNEGSMGNAGSEDNVSNMNNQGSYNPGSANYQGNTGNGNNEGDTGYQGKAGKPNSSGNQGVGNNIGTGYNQESVNYQGSMSGLDNLIVEKVKYFFFKIADLCVNASMDQVYTILKTVYTAVIKAHLNYVPCFAKVKNGEVKGVTVDSEIEKQLDEFKKLYEYHVNKFGCTTAAKSLDENTLNSKINEIDTEIDNTIKNLVPRLENASMDDVLNLYLLGMKTVIGLLVQYVPYFNKAQNGVNGMSLEQIANVHYNYVRDKFKEYTNTLKCK